MATWQQKQEQLRQASESIAVAQSKLNSIVALAEDTKLLIGNSQRLIDEVYNEPLEDDEQPPPVDPLFCSVNGPVEVDIDKTAVYEAVASGGTGPYSYRWLVEDEQVEGANESHFRLNAAAYGAGEVWVAVNVKDSNGEEVGDAMRVTIKPLSQPPVGPVIHVGPGMHFEELHEVPINSNPQNNVEVHCHYRGHSYNSNLIVQRSNAIVKAINGPNGERVVLDGTNATQNKDWITNWTSQLSGKGILSIIKRDVNDVIENVKFIDFKITGALRDSNYLDRSGVVRRYQDGAAGIYLITCRKPRISGCVLVDNEQGVYGKADASWQGMNTLEDVMVEWCNIHSNGVSGSDRYHNTYIEADGITYQFNEYGEYYGAGSALKDRSAGAIICFNKFSGGIRHLDLVDPESGAPILLSSPRWGHDYWFGNVHEIFRQSSIVHYGFDGQAKHTRYKLHGEYNTVLAKTGSKVTFFKVNGAPTEVLLQNNILHYDGGLYAVMYQHETGQAGTYFWMNGGFVTANKVYKTYDSNWNPTNNVGLDGWNSQLLVHADPKWTKDKVLYSTSPCVNAAKDTTPFGAVYQWTKFGWQPRASHKNLGAAELTELTPTNGGGGGSGSSLTFRSIETGIDASQSGAWSWGIALLNALPTSSGPVFNDICVTAHNGSSIVWENTDGGFLKDQVLEGAGVYRPLVMEIDGIDSLLFRNSAQQSLWQGTPEGTMKKIAFPYGEGDPSLPLCYTSSNPGLDGFSFGHNASYGQNLPIGKRWLWNGSNMAPIAWVHPMYIKASASVRDEMTKEFAKPSNRFLRLWWLDTEDDFTLLCGKGSYGGSLICRALDGSGNDITSQTGLPTWGTPIAYFVNEGIGCVLIHGAGLYMLTPEGKYALVPGPVTDFLKVVGDYYHQRWIADFRGTDAMDLVLLDPRGKQVRAFEDLGQGAYREAGRWQVWDGEACDVGDVDGDGMPEIVIGQENTVRVLKVV